MGSKGLIVTLVLGVNVLLIKLFSAVRLGKSLLKNERMNIPLWVSYALLEVYRGNLDEVRAHFRS
jgi:hypothetical protein